MNKDLKDLANTTLVRMREGLEFIDQNEGVGGNGEGWLRSDNLLVTKALLRDRSGRFTLTGRDWQRLEMIMGKPWVAWAQGAHDD